MRTILKIIEIKTVIDRNWTLLDHELNQNNERLDHRIEYVVIDFLLIDLKRRF